MPSTKSAPKSLHNQPQHSWAFDAIGTQWWIGIYESLDAIELPALQSAITARIESYDKTYSRFRADSLVTRISRAAGEYELPADSGPLLDWYRTLYELTDGAVTPLVGQLLSDAGYDADYSLQPGTLQPTPDWDSVMSCSGQMLRTKQPLLLDFGAAGKGYLVDILHDLLLARGVTSFCIDASGDMRSHGLLGGLRVGMEHPLDATTAVGVIELRNQALCASATTRRQWGDYHHVMDPRSQSSPKHIAAVWVTADTCMQADGLTTALFFTDPDQLQKQCTFDYALMYADNSIIHSPGLPAELFSSKESHA